MKSSKEQPKLATEHPKDPEFPDRVLKITTSEPFEIPDDADYVVIDCRDDSKIPLIGASKGEMYRLPGDGTIEHLGTAGQQVNAAYTTANMDKWPEAKNVDTAGMTLQPEPKVVELKEELKTQPSPAPSEKKAPETKPEPEKEPSVAVAKREAALKRPWTERGIELKTLEEMKGFARSVYASAIWAPKDKNGNPVYKNPEDIVIALQFGAEIGLAPMASLQNIAVINGKPSIFGPIGLALIHASGELEDIEYKTFGSIKFDRKTKAYSDDSDFGAKWRFKRRGIATWFESEWTVEDDMIAGLWRRNVHAVYPKDMIMYRAFWKGAKMAFADVLKGVQGREFTDHEPIDTTYVRVSSEDSKSAKLAEALGGKR